MKCEEFEDRLNATLDDRRRPEWEPELRLHGEHCARCRDLAAAYGVLMDGFYAFATPDPPGDLAVRVVDELRSRPSTARRVTVASALLATAAAALFVLPLWQINRSGDAPPAARPAVAQRSPAPVDWEPVDWEDTENLTVMQRMFVSLSDDDESTDPYAELAKGTGQGLANVVLYMPTIGSSPGMIAPGSVVSGNPTWPQRMSEGLRPVTESVSETLDLLLEALPNPISAGRS